ncbi:MAG: NADH:flavin oxidoreductase [Acidimicrobiia bacterium]
MSRYPQVKNLGSPSALRDRLAELGVELPVAEDVRPDGPLAQPVTFTDGSAGERRIANRFAILPMEGWDGTTDGRPTDLVRRRWQRFGESGAGLVWGEATAVVPEGRANPNQLVLDERTVDDLAGLRRLLDPAQVVGLQLTHSGRWARPDGAPRPRTATAHPVLDARLGIGDEARLSDDELDELQARFVAAAVLAGQAGFDFVDVKCCHGYLLHEVLAGRDRPGRYGGDLEDRTRFVRGVIAGIREAAPDLAVAVRLSAFDLVPYRAGPDGVGEPEPGELPRPFGADETGHGIDLAEAHELLGLLAAAGVGLVCTTAGSPYYNPHLQRPAYFPPSDGYDPPEDPLVGVARQVAATAELAAAHPDLTIVGSGYSYLQDWLPHVAQEVVAAGGADLVGLGRMALSYPTLPADVLAGRHLERRLICRTFSDCTTAPRAGLVSGCYPLDPFYKDRPERVELVQAKRRAKEARR